MMQYPPAYQDLSALLLQAARAFEREGPVLQQLNTLAHDALGAERSAIFVVGAADQLTRVAGDADELLETQTREFLSKHTTYDDSASECDWRACRILLSDGVHLGAWSFRLPEGSAVEVWDVLTHALTPFVLLGLRQSYWQDQVSAARTQLERRIREVEAVYEIGQATDEQDINRLMDLITEKAASVMDAQACSLMLKEPESGMMTIVASYGLTTSVVENTRILIGSGIAGYVAATGQPLRMNSLDDVPELKNQHLTKQLGVASSICMPMKDEQGEVQGVLCIRRNLPTSTFNDDDLRLFSIFATHASLAINNAKLYKNLNNKIQELSTLSDLTETITSTLDLDQVLNQVADNIVDVVKFDRCRIYLCDVDTGRFSARIVRGFEWNPDEKRDANIGLGEGVIGSIAQRQVPVLVDRPDLEPPHVRQYAHTLNMTSFYAQPIVARGRCIGVVVVSHSDPARWITADGIGLLSTFVHQAGIAIENARFYASQERRYAELTTLYEVSRNLAVTSGVQKAAKAVNDLAAKITDSDAGVLLHFESNKEAMRAIEWRGIPDHLEKHLKDIVAALPVASAAQALRAPRLLSPQDIPTYFGPEWTPFFAAFLERHHSSALIPLVVEDIAIGFLLLGKQHEDYGVEQLKLIAVASSQAAVVLSGATSYERRIDQRELELSAIYELMQKVRTATSLDEALSSILEIVASLVWSDQSILYTVDEEGETMTARAARGVDASAVIGSVTLPLSGEHLAARALRARTGLIASSVAEEDDPAPDPEIARQSVLAIPLLVGDETVGVLTMQAHTPGAFNEESVMLLHLVASQAATIYREMSSFRTLTRYTDNILRSIAAGVITINKDGYIVTWNARAEEIINLRAHQIIGRHYKEFFQMLQVDTAVREETMQMVELTAQTGKVFTRNQLCYHSPQGDETYVNLSASQLKNESGEYLGVVVVFEDVTNEMQMKEEVERVSKLAETGQLAANIAHELRNPLSSIKGAAQLLRNELPDEFIDMHGEFLDIIIEEVNGLNRMTSEFLEFSRVSPPQMQSVSLNQILGRLIQFMSAYLNDQDIEFAQNYAEDLPNVLVDKSQIEQVIRNIVINAAQSMPHGGKLTIVTRYLAEQDTAEVDFEDKGVGINANKLEKIWTPFFTTKTKGTGLGLAIARKIVETHGGRLTARSMPGEGSTFTMQLPVHPLYTTVVPQSRTDISDQRSDRPGGYFEWSSTDLA
ncbi:MAG: GAF domain-containing protein [Capsulimonas sp.]|uniref:GAF domain-containing protein n=1 Tax=Capsulimonas sp. TaxID=2494211 RepID=UPI003262D0C5